MWLVREREREEANQRRNINGRSKEEAEELETEEVQYSISLWFRIKHSRLLKAIIILILVAILVPILIVLFMDMTAIEYDTEHTCIIRNDYRIPCGSPTPTLNECLDINCCYDEMIKYCFHPVPSQYQYSYNSANSSYTPKLKYTPFKEKNNEQVYLTIIKQNENDLSITLHEKPQILNNHSTPNPNYDIHTYPESMSAEVTRKNTSDIILSTSYGPTIVSTRYWEWTVDLHAEQLFGLDHFRFDNENVTRVIYKNVHHGALPKFMAFRDGMFYGLTIDHTGPLEVTVLPSKLIILRLISGEFLTLHLFIGPTPYDVLNQQRLDQELLVVPPYWALGVHLCRDGKFTSVNSALEEINNFHQTVQYENVSFPYDSDCIHEHLFSFTNSDLSQTEKTDLKAALAELKTRSKRYLMTLAPQVSKENPGWQTAIDKAIVYTHRASGNVTTGSYLGKEVIFPDYSLNDTQSWFNDVYAGFIDVDPDAFVLRSNWPENNGYELEEIDDFQYISKELMEAMSETVPWDSITSTEHIQKHNSYGSNFARVVSNATAKPGEKFIMSASYDSNTMAHVQHVNTTWVNFKKMLTQTISHSMFGGRLISTPVCGSTDSYNEETNLELCLRWYLTAATMPLFRISSELPRRDPTHLESTFLRENAISAINIRYTLLPYYYTILTEHPGLMIRPMFFDFYKDNNTFPLDEQYMIGDGLLVVQPVVAPIHTVKVYLPNIPGGWFEFWGGNKYGTIGWNVLNLVANDLVIFVAAGKIIPMQSSVASNAEETRLLPLKLAVALDCSGNKGSCRAEGSFRTKDSHVWKFDATENTLQVSNFQPTMENVNYLTSITAKIYGIKSIAALYTCNFIDVNTDKPSCNFTKIY